MKILRINSKNYGLLEILLDDEDYERLENDFPNMNWTITKNRNKLYAEKRVNKKNIYLHRYIMNCPKGKYVDHINHNTLDNRKENLRITNNADNLRNGQLRPNNTTGINGVYYDKTRKKYVARIRVNYKIIHLGSFNTLKEATQKRKEAEVKYWVSERGDEFDLPRI